METKGLSNRSAATRETSTRRRDRGSRRRYEVLRNSYLLYRCLPSSRGGSRPTNRFTSAFADGWLRPSRSVTSLAVTIGRSNREYEPDRARAADLVGEEPVHDRLPQRDDLLRGPLGLLRDLDHAPEEEREPVLVRPLHPDRVQERVVLRPVPLQEEPQIQQRAREDPLPAEVERDQQPPDTAVAVEERVDRLELRMDQRDPDQRRDRVIRLDERLERGQGRPDLVGGRRDIDGIRDRGRSRRPM